MPYLSALEVCSGQGAVQIHVYLYLYLSGTGRHCLTGGTEQKTNKESQTLSVICIPICSTAGTTEHKQTDCVRYFTVAQYIRDTSF